MDTKTTEIVKDKDQDSNKRGCKTETSAAHFSDRNINLRILRKNPKQSMSVITNLVEASGKKKLLGSHWSLNHQALGSE